MSKRTETLPAGGGRRRVPETIRRARMRLATAWSVLTARHAFVVRTEPSLRLTILGTPAPEDFTDAASVIDMAHGLEATGRAAREILHHPA